MIRFSHEWSWQSAWMVVPKMFFKLKRSYLGPEVVIRFSHEWSWQSAWMVVPKMFFKLKRSGPSCSKLTMSLVNDSWKFTSSDTHICWNCSAKAIHIFSAKNNRILYIESAKTVNEMTLNELVKLTTLWTTGPWCQGCVMYSKPSKEFLKRYLRSLMKPNWPQLASLAQKI